MRKQIDPDLDRAEQVLFNYSEISAKGSVRVTVILRTSATKKRNKIKIGILLYIIVI